MGYADQDQWLQEIDLGDYEDAVKRIVEIARQAANAEVAVLFLTVDGILLEAASWKSESRNPPPASLLPTYRLLWWEQDDRKLGGITAYVAVRRKVQNLNRVEVREHPAWKGRWDDVFLEGVQTRCTGILAVPVQTKIGAKKGEARVHGVLKVENPGDATTIGRFKPEHEKAIVGLAQAVAAKLGTSSEFWRRFVQTRADLKVSYLVELPERGRSIGYNLSQGLGYALHLLAAWLGCHQCAVHVFWRNGDAPRVDVLRPIDFATEDSPRQKGRELFRDTPAASELVSWLRLKVGPQIVQRAVPISRELWKMLFPATGPQDKVDIVRLKAGKYDLGAVVAPQSPLWASGGDEAETAGTLDTLTRLAINVVAVLGRFMEDEYETEPNTYLPEHRPAGVSKTCAILFADIRNFSQLTQVLRMMGKPGLIERFLDHYCARMGRVVGDAPLGRVDKFLGDGIFALFGEYLDTPEEDRKNEQNHKKVVIAVHCAWKMLEQFRAVYTAWVTMGLSRTDISYGLWYADGDPEEETELQAFHDLRKLFNEDVEIDLAIGINIGEVFFDYLGDPSHREYTAIGDHVNFTQRLQDAARRYDEQKGRVRANILVSQAAYRALSDNGYLLHVRDPIWLQAKGFALAYPVYELDYEDVDHEKVAATVRDLEDPKRLS